MTRVPRVTLGTAQLGMPYGIANRAGMPDEAAAFAILDAAWAGGITCFDTARSYGEAEARIGAWRARTGHDPVLVSKFPALDAVGRNGGGGGDGDGERVRRAFAESCAALGVDRLDGYLAHRARDILRPAVGETLRALVAEGRLGAFGFSAYTPAEIDRAIEVEGLRLVQAPVNAFDRRFTESGVLDRCRERGMAVFARSVFLQGLFFLDPEALPAHLAPARAALQELRAIAQAGKLGIAALALAAVRELPGITSIVIGVDTLGQLKANLAAAAEAAPEAGVLARVRALGRTLPAAVLDPSRWPQRAPGECA